MASGLRSALGPSSTIDPRRDARISSTGVSTDNTGTTWHLAVTREPLDIERLNDTSSSKVFHATRLNRYTVAGATLSYFFSMQCPNPPSVSVQSGFAGCTPTVTSRT